MNLYGTPSYSTARVSGTVCRRLQRSEALGIAPNQEDASLRCLAVFLARVASWRAISCPTLTPTQS